MLAANTGGSHTEATGCVFDVSKGCVDDGPGLRTVVFLKGCHLDCPWCHNPEGRSPEPTLAFHQSRCIGCDRCRDVCPRPWRGGRFREGCTACGACAEACPSGARTVVGRTMGVGEIVSEATGEATFMKATGGGVTFSGGEPMAQPRLLFSCAEALRARGIHTAVETAGFWPARLAAPLAAEVDLVLFDLKHVSLGKAREAVGADYALALGNHERLLASKVALEIRMTLVPGFNAGCDDLRAMARWLAARAPEAPLRLLPFHRMTAAKDDVFGARYPYAHVPPLTGKDVEEAVALLRSDGLEADAA